MPLIDEQHEGSLVLLRATMYVFAPDIAFQLTVTDVALDGVAVTPVGAGPVAGLMIGAGAIGVRICASAFAPSASTTIEEAWNRNLMVLPPSNAFMVSLPLP
jgi:hypothetical protein